MIFWCEKVVSSCPSCQKNSHRYARPIAIPRHYDLHEAATIDIFVLDSASHLAALCCIDLCTGQPKFKVIGRQPRDSASVFEAYVERVASVRGAQKHLGVDREGVFKSRLSADLYEHLGVQSEMMSSKEQLTTAERTIQIARYTIDRVRNSGGCPETPQEWNILLCDLEKFIANEVNRSGIAPAQREFGKSTFLLRNFLTDTSVTASRSRISSIFRSCRTRTSTISICSVRSKISRFVIIENCRPRRANPHRERRISVILARS